MLCKIYIVDLVNNCFESNKYKPSLENLVQLTRGKVLAGYPLLTAPSTLNKIAAV